MADSPDSSGVHETLTRTAIRGTQWESERMNVLNFF